MNGTYHSSLIVLSLAIAILASYQALDFTARIQASRVRAQKLAWNVAGTWILGLGLWSLHFVGMLSRLPHWSDSFDPRLASAAGLVALMVISGLLRLADTPVLGRRRWAFGSVWVGLGTALMCLLNVASLHLLASVEHRGWVILAWAVLATAAAAGLLPMTRAFCARGRAGWLRRRVLAAAGMGVSISVVLHLSISALLAASKISAEHTSNADASALVWLGGVISLVVLLSMGAALGLSELVVRLYLRAQQLTGSVHHLNTQLQHLATHDPLTGLPNRPMLAARLERGLAAARAGEGHVAVLYLDLDGFKTINDTYGHGFGDQLLCVVGERLTTELRRGSLARVGGDEFVAVLDGMQEPDTALRIADRLIEVMQRDFAVQGTDMRVTPSIGIAFYPQDGETVEELIAHADVAMYAARTRGRNGYQLYDAGMQARAQRALQIQRGLQTATEDGTLSLHFQSKHDGVTGRIVGAEALARWHHPDLGQVPPIEFIGVAERSGQIGRIGEWVIRESCRQLCEWRDRGLPVVRVAINLSAVQLNQQGLVETVSRIVAEAGLHAEHVLFEITETMAMHDAERTTAILCDFRARGFEFAIDDFGTGYSSLAYLQKFKVRQLKIDQFFVNALDDGEHGPAAIINAIIELAHTLGTEVVAEGVETASQAAQLRAMGCDQIQGYFLSRPMPPLQFEQMCVAAQAAGAKTGSGLLNGGSALPPLENDDGHRSQRQ